MWQGLVVGAGSAMALSVLLVGAVSLLAPTAESEYASMRHASTPPEAPQMQVSEERPPVRPDPLPQAVEPVAAESSARSGADVEPDGAVALPAGSQYNQPPVDVEPVTSGEDSALRLTEARTTARLDADALTVAPSPDTSSAAQPQAALTIAGVSLPAADVAPDRPAEVSDGAPQTFREVAASTEIIATEPPEPATEVATPTPQTQPQRVVTTVSQSAAETAQQAAPAPRDLPEAAAVTLVETPVAVATPSAEPAPDPVSDIVPRRIVLDSARDDAEAQPGQAARRALVANAEPFKDPQGKPLFSIILIDDPSTGMDRANLLAFDFPVTFAVDPSAPDAAATAKFYRDAGHEVLMLGDGLPLSGSAQDIEVALAGALAQVPGVVGILDQDGGGFGSNRQALAALLTPMSEVGLGLVTYGGGLNAGLATAERQGVPAEPVYRTIDADGERATVITRYLDRATFEAAQDGRALVVGRTAPDTVTALFSWALGRRSDTVAVVPISHLLLTGSDG